MNNESLYPSFNDPERNNRIIQTIEPQFPPSEYPSFEDLSDSRSHYIRQKIHKIGELGLKFLNHAAKIHPLY